MSAPAFLVKKNMKSYKALRNNSQAQGGEIREMRTIKRPRTKGGNMLIDQK